MKTQIGAPSQLRWHEIAWGTAYTIVGGAVGFVDTDISAEISGTGAIVLVQCYTAANQDGGVREAGSSIDTKRAMNAGVNMTLGFARVVGGHIEFYRAAADNNYYLLGYLL